MVGHFIGSVVTLTTNFYRTGADDVTRAIRLLTLSQTMDFDSSTVDVSLVGAIETADDCHQIKQLTRRLLVEVPASQTDSDSNPQRMPSAVK